MGTFKYKDAKQVPPYVREGIIFVNKKPEYVVEYIYDESNPRDYITVYKPESEDNPVKAYTLVDRTKQFKGTTKLSAIARSRIKPERKVERVVDPPLFMAPIVEGVSTFTGKFGDGFYEREPDQLVAGNNQMRVEKGDYTGVFISLDDIRWGKEYVATKEIIARYKANETLWFYL